MSNKKLLALVAAAWVANEYRTGRLKITYTKR